LAIMSRAAFEVEVLGDQVWGVGTLPQLGEVGGGLPGGLAAEAARGHGAQRRVGRRPGLRCCLYGDLHLPGDQEVGQPQGVGEVLVVQRGERQHGHDLVLHAAAGGVQPGHGPDGLLGPRGTVRVGLAVPRHEGGEDDDAEKRDEHEGGEVGPQRDTPPSPPPHRPPIEELHALPTAPSAPGVTRWTGSSSARVSGTERRPISPVEV
jgi:hypothetical protein